MNSQVAPPTTDTHGVQDISFGLGFILRLSLICDFPVFVVCLFVYFCAFAPVTAKSKQRRGRGKIDI